MVTAVTLSVHWAAAAVLALAAMTLPVVWKKPHCAVGAWLLATALLPSWLVIDLGVALPPGTVLALPVIGALLLQPLAARIEIADVALISFLLVATLALLMAGSPRSTYEEMLAVWVVSYALGRLSGIVVQLRTLERLFLTAMAVVAVWAVVEATLGWHLFESLAGSSANWNEIQVRGNRVRAEAAFGHAIALGAALVLALPVAIVRLRGVARIGAVGLILAGVLASGSRGAIIGFAVAMIGSIWVSGARGPHIAGLGVIGVVGSMLALPIFLGADSLALQQNLASSEYRAALLRFAMSHMELIGLSTRASYTTTGQVAYGPFLSIDNTVLRIGLEFGVIAAALALLLMGMPTIRVFSRATRQPFELGLVATVPILATVSLITQWQAFVFFVAGVAVAVVHPGLRDEEAAARSRKSPGAQFIPAGTAPVA